MRAPLPSNYAIGENAGKGTLLDDPSLHSALQNDTGTASLEAVTDAPDDITKVIQIDYDAGADSLGQVQRSAIGTNIVCFPMTTFGVWVNNPTSHTIGFTITIYPVTTSRKVINTFAAAANSGWQFYVASNTVFSSDDIIAEDPQEFFRITAYKTLWPWVAGDYLQAGKLYLNPRSRPKFMIATDDGYATNITDGGDGTYTALASDYGFTGTAFIMLAGIYAIMLQRLMLVQVVMMA